MPNAAVFPPDARGIVGLYNSAGEVDLVADVSGYFTDRLSQIRAVLLLGCRGY